VLSLVAAGALFWLAYIDLKDRLKPEPRMRILLAFLLGLGAGVAALALMRGLGTRGIDLASMQSVWTRVAYCMAVIGPVEEGAKFLVFYVFVLRWAECDEPVDGFVYAGTIGCGFATFENLLLLPNLPFMEQLAKGAVVPITHALFSAIWGLALTRPGRRWTGVVGALLLSMALHGLYDAVLLGLDIKIASSLTILGIWIAVLLRVRYLVPPDQRTSNRRSFWGLLLAGGGVVVGILGFLLLRVQDDAPPRIWFADGGVLGPLSGDVRLQIHVHDQGVGVGEVVVKVDGQPLERVGGAWIWHSADFSDGIHRLQVFAKDRSDRPNRAARYGEIFSDNTPPLVEVSAASRVARQGGSLVLLLRSKEPLSSLQATWGDQDLALYTIHLPDGSLLYRGMRGVWVEHPAGKETITLQATDVVGHEARRDIDIEIVPTFFAHSPRVLQIPRAKQKIMTQPRPGTDQARRNAAYNHPIAVQLWEGAHMWPTPGARTSPFGKVRTYNTGKRRHHLGVDIDGQPGTPVYAANHGMVTLSVEQRAFGHVVIVGHGQGMSTSYNHLLEPGVPMGTMVRKGDQVGLVGSTGLSTGPHLHWGMELGGIAVDAEQWLNHTFDGVGVDDWE